MLPSCGNERGYVITAQSVDATIECVVSKKAAYTLSRAAFCIGEKGSNTG